MLMHPSILFLCWTLRGPNFKGRKKRKGEKAKERNEMEVRHPIHIFRYASVSVGPKALVSARGLALLTPEQGFCPWVSLGNLSPHSYLIATKFNDLV